MKSIVAAVLLSGSATILLAQNATWTGCPFGYPPGYGRSLTPEQRVEHRATVQKWVSDLRAKRDAGTITAEELALLQRVEQRGGPCVTGAPRGPGAGRGPRAANGGGFGYRRGLRDGTGPRSALGTCPLTNTPAGGANR